MAAGDEWLRRGESAESVEPVKPVVLFFSFFFFFSSSSPLLLGRRQTREQTGRK
jgi:hypothetical protein